MPFFTALAIGTTIASATTQAVSQIKAGNAAKQAGQAQQAAAEDQAQLAEYNAGVARLQATDAVARGTIAESRFRSGVRQVVGGQRASFGANHIAVGFGSAVDVQADAAMLGELDALTIRTNAARDAWGFNVQAEDLTRQAALTRKSGVAAAAAGREAQSGARVAAVGTLLGTGPSLLLDKYGKKT